MIFIKRFREVLSISMLMFLAVCKIAAYSKQPTKSQSRNSQSMPLRLGWKIQSACAISADGAQLSSPQYHSQGWITASVPTTVLAAQVAAGIYKDPYVGLNLSRIPGVRDPKNSPGTFFANLPMPQNSPYRCGWWYRTQFSVPANFRGKTMWLHFDGINYRANLWVGGHLIADSKQIAGAYRTYDFDVTKAVAIGGLTAVAIEVFAPGPADLGINWVDWNPSPPDKNMGLWGPVNLVATGPVSVRFPFIITHFEDSALHVADITVSAQLQNATDHVVTGTVVGTFLES